jgi:hypothetical protein
MPQFSSISQCAQVWYNNHDIEYGQTMGKEFIGLFTKLSGDLTLILCSLNAMSSLPFTNQTSAICV